MIKTIFFERKYSLLGRRRPTPLLCYFQKKHILPQEKEKKEMMEITLRFWVLGGGKWVFPLMTIVKLSCNFKFCGSSFAAKWELRIQCVLRDPERSASQSGTQRTARHDTNTARPWGCIAATANSTSLKTHWCCWVLLSVDDVDVDVVLMLMLMLMLCWCWYGGEGTELASWEEMFPCQVSSANARSKACTKKS